MHKSYLFLSIVIVLFIVTGCRKSKSNNVWEVKDNNSDDMVIQDIQNNNMSDNIMNDEVIKDDVVNDYDETELKVTSIEALDINTNTQAKKQFIALTFDDGPNLTTTVEILDKLEEHNIVASFFVIGNNIDSNTSEVMKRAYQMGCEIENHSKNHLHMNTLTEEEMKEEITYTSEKIKEVIGQYPKFFRPPYISVNDLMYDAIDLTFVCGINAEDWDNNVGSGERAERIINQVKDGTIILLHDFAGNHYTVEALDIIIPKLKEQGYEFVTLERLFMENNIELDRNSNVMYTIVK